ncbi:glycosyl hydrolase family 28-related protein [Paraburkholderia phymatum]|uniref:glycosyl hydrolase family 28-related protein n=1 Tax=Paraburkholderia phymatum TaxID=148447 RepID=UPI00317EE838
MPTRRDALKVCLASCSLAVPGHAEGPSSNREAAHTTLREQTKRAGSTTSRWEARCMSSTDSLAASVTSSHGDPVDVRKFGARGDGRTDDTAAIRAAVAHAFPAGRNVYLPAGQYLLSDTLELSHRYASTEGDIANNVIAVTLTGDGPHSTWLIWASNIPLTVARKAMIILEGFIGLQRLTLAGGRKYLGGSTHTPFFGIVCKGTCWRNMLQEVDIRYVAVCFSAGVVRRYENSRHHGIEIDPDSGGIELNVDFAQMRIASCEFRSEVVEFADGTWSPATVKDSRGQSLVEQCVALEVGRQQSVNIEFDTCVFDNVNTKALHTIRFANAGDVMFRNSLLSAPSISTVNTYAIHEETDSGGSNIYLDHCYLIGGVASLRTTQGTLRIRNSNGENVSPDTALNGVAELIRVIGQGTTIDIDGFDIGRGIHEKQLTLSYADQLRDATTNPAGNTTAAYDRRLYSLRNITGVSKIRCGHETFAFSSRVEAVTSLLPDFTAELGRRRIPASYILNVSDDADCRAGFASAVQRGGQWMYGATLDAHNCISWFVDVDATTCYDFSVDVHVELRQSGAPTGGDVNIVATFHDKDRHLIGDGPNSGVFLLGGVTPTNGYGFLQSGTTVTIHSQHVVPPARAAFARIEISIDPPTSRYASAAIGNVLFGPAGANLILHTALAPQLGAAGMPSTGVWQRGDFVRRSSSTPSGSHTNDPPSVFGWLRETNGDSNVAGVDWLPLGGLSTD